MSDAPEALPPLSELPEDMVECAICFKEFAKEYEFVEMDWGNTCVPCAEELERQEEGLLVNAGISGLKAFIGVMKKS
jgi:hypothetical protein